MAVMLNYLLFVPLVMDLIFGVVLVTVNGPSNFLVSSRKIRTVSTDSMRYLLWVVIWT